MRNNSIIAIICQIFVVIRPLSVNARADKMHDLLLFEPTNLCI